jgi:hypothetical protein
MNKFINISEDVWDPKNLKKIGRVLRYSDTSKPLYRYDESGGLVEQYESIALNKMMRPDIISKHQVDDILNIGLISKSNNGEITDYYLYLKGDPVKYIDRYSLNKKLAEVSDGLGLRYFKDGSFAGVYYGGVFDKLIVKKFGGEGLFISHLREYYLSKASHPVGTAYCIVKDFGNEAVYIQYAKDSLVTQ